mmetsp:Transcript_26389/g.45410  ORF Transcript_26389/g.45410 Transcript_26389/m.45410 type:complete len:220 (-) Transcript_26389:7-666(-)
MEICLLLRVDEAQEVVAQRSSDARHQRGNEQKRVGVRLLREVHLHEVEQLEAEQRVIRTCCHVPDATKRRHLYRPPRHALHKHVRKRRQPRVGEDHDLGPYEHARQQRREQAARPVHGLAKAHLPVPFSAFQDMATDGRGRRPPGGAEAPGGVDTILEDILHVEGHLCIDLPFGLCSCQTKDCGLNIAMQLGDAAICDVIYRPLGSARFRSTKGCRCNP